MSPRRDERGAALVMVLMLLVVLGTVSTLALERTRLVAGSTVDGRGRLAALYAAEGGLAHTRHALRDDPGHTGSTLEVGGCAVETVVAGSASSGWHVVVEARWEQPGRPPHRCRIEAELRAGPGLPRVWSWRD